MGLYYKITKAEADLLGRFMYSSYEAFDPYVSEQKDGSFIVSEEMYDKLKDNAKFKLVDFKSKVKITEQKVKEDLKPTPLP